MQRPFVLCRGYGAQAKGVASSRDGISRAFMLKEDDTTPSVRSADSTCCNKCFSRPACGSIDAEGGTSYRVNALGLWPIIII